MELNIIAIVKHIRPQDVLDILFITVVVYHLYIWFRSTKAFKALIGLLALGIIFTARAQVAWPPGTSGISERLILGDPSISI